ncbi:hypothetical protein ACEWY4_008919 [Coilia grayii]|uniref:Neuronal PAS domain-containing protein 2-like n=1 Tax=Coilia grayii TaxID=363190 RepID=A0ABD1K4Y9_9TELE
MKGQEVYMCPPLEPQAETVSGAHSVSSHSSRKSSHTDSASNSSVRYTDVCTSSRQSASIGPEKTSSRMSQSGSKTLIQQRGSSELLPLSPSCSQHSAMQQHQQQQQQQSMYPFQQPQLGVMHQLKEQLEERTRILQADIKTQQAELHDIKEKLQLANIQMLLQQPLHSDFPSAPPQQQGPGRPSPHSQAGVIRQTSGHPKAPICGPHSSMPQHAALLRDTPTSSSPQQQQQQQQRLGRGSSVQAVSLPVQTHTSLTMPFYSNPMLFSHTSPRALQEPSQRHTDTGQYTQDGQLRMLLNQPMQTLMQDGSGNPQQSQCSTAIQQTKYSLEQQMMPPSFPVQQVNCNAVLVPSAVPVFTSPIMIPHNTFITHQAQPAYPPHPQQQQPQPQPHPQQQQQQHFFQMQPQGLLHSSQTQAFFHTTNAPQHGAVGYIQQQPQQQPPQAQQQHHSQTQAASLSDFRNLLQR